MKLNVRFLLICGFATILTAMIWVTYTASLDRSVFSAGSDLWNDPWGRATLFDAYFGFLVVYLWIFAREANLFRRVLWFLLLMGLGNIAIAVYFLIQLRSPATNQWRRIFPSQEGAG